MTKNLDFKNLRLDFFHEIGLLLFSDVLKQKTTNKYRNWKNKTTTINDLDEYVALEPFKKRTFYISGYAWSKCFSFLQIFI